MKIVISKTLDAEDRKKLKRHEFGLPEEGKYPMPDKAHAKNAKARAKQQLNAGKLSKADYERIVKKADKILSESSPWPEDFLSKLAANPNAKVRFWEKNSARIRGRYAYKDLTGSVVMAYKKIAGKSVPCYIIDHPTGDGALLREFVTALTETVKTVCRKNEIAFLTSGWAEHKGPKVAVFASNGKFYIAYGDE